MKIEHNISYCGNFCDLCPAFIGQNGTDEDRQKAHAAWKRYFKLDFKPEVIRCRGCQSADPWKGGNMLPSRACLVRSCAKYNEIPHCAYCTEFPCSIFKTSIPGSDLREKQEKATGLTFSDQEYQANIAPFEGLPHLIEIRQKLASDHLIKPRPCQPANAPAPFPDNLSPKQKAVMEPLYSLLSRVFVTKAATYAELILAERRQPVIRALLWSVSLYGLMQGNCAVLDSRQYPDKKECSRFVRKSDNQLHGSVQEAVAALSELDLNVRFTSQKKDWQIALETGQLAGGVSTLNSLQSYVKFLAARYGEPVYSGSFNLKGPAFKRFSSIDMQGFIPTC